MTVQRELPPQKPLGRLANWLETTFGPKPTYMRREHNMYSVPLPEVKADSSPKPASDSGTQLDEGTLGEVYSRMP